MDINNYMASGIIEMYVMGVCSPEEKTELELLRTQYPSLDIAVVQFEKDFEHNLVSTATVEPTIVTDEKILLALQSMHIPAPVISINTLQSVPKKNNWLKPIAA